MQNEEIVLLEPTTAAFISQPIQINQDAAAMSVVSNGYTGAESAVIEIYDKAQEDWYPVLGGGQEYALDVNTNILDFWFTWGQYRINKSATVSPAGITIKQYTPTRFGV
jgi:hypothetical protein